MVNQLRRRTIYRILCVVMALHILNFSIDAPDPEPAGQPENLSYNDIESVTELVAEQWLKIDNAFPEHDEADDEDGSCITKKLDFECIMKEVEQWNYTPFFYTAYLLPILRAPEVEGFSGDIAQPPEA